MASSTRKGEDSLADPLLAKAMAKKLMEIRKLKEPQLVALETECRNFLQCMEACMKIFDELEGDNG